ncbi:MAG: hypothetical protein PHY62_08010 [Gallionella sp.]|nr:hypothetical protein [Gallionella sp.]
MQSLVDNLPKNDVHKALMELTEWIESAADNIEFKLDHQFAVLRLLDEAAQIHVRKLSRDYFTLQELNRFQENRLWLVLGNYYRHTAAAYLAVFNRYCQGDKGEAVVKPQLTLLIGRALKALSGQLKFVCTHFGPVPTEIWSNIGRLYLHAEQQGCLDQAVSLYTGAGMNVTIKQLTVRLLGWYGCAASTLNPLALHFTERLMMQFSSEGNIGVRLDEETLFSFDLNRAAPPQRVKVDSTLHPAIRFVSFNAVIPKLESLLKTLDKGIVPEDLNLGGTYDAALVAAAARHLMDFLSAPPLRRGPRRNVKISTSVANGFAKVLEHTELALNFSEEQSLSWQIEDISSDGFRTVLPGQKTEDIHIGSLLGMMPEGVPHWGVAIVRRLMRDTEGQLHIGCERLSNRFAGVALSQSGGGGGVFEDGQPGIWLYPKAEGVGEVLLLMKVDTYSQNRSLQTMLDGQRYLLIPSKLKERGKDYDLGVFRVIRQEVEEE